MSIIKNNICICGCGLPCVKLYKKGHGRKNRITSESHKEKISLANKGKVRSQESIQKIKDTKTRLGTLNRKHTPEEKLRQSILAKEKGFGLWMIGKKPKPESIEKFRIKRIGHEVGESTRKKISEKNKGENNGMYKRGHSEEAKKKISEASKLMWQNKNSRYKILNHPNRTLSCKKGALTVHIKYPNGKYTNTKPEIEMANILDDLEIKYKKSHPFNDLKNPYLCDFFIESIKTVIEVDGKYWHNYPNYLERDVSRTLELQENGYIVLRYWENEFNLEVVEKDIDSIIDGTYNKKMFIK